MKIETKFNIGDSIYFMKNNMVHEFKVKQISIYVFDDGSRHITYVDTRNINGRGDEIKEESKNIFATKQELLDSL